MVHVSLCIELYNVTEIIDVDARTAQHVETFKRFGSKVGPL